MNINRLIFPGFWFGKTRREDALELARRGVGGFCIYGGTLESVRELVHDLRAASTSNHLFICADYEDGLGKWIPGTTWVFSNLAVGASQSEEVAYQKGLTLAREARNLGVDWIFAPVLDLCDEPQNPIVNTRSFGANPQQVAQLGAALCRGLTDGGVLNSIKHFPGHGRTTQDSHLRLPTLNRTRAELEQNELVPFRAALPSWSAGEANFSPRLQCLVSACIDRSGIPQSLRRLRNIPAHTSNIPSPFRRLPARF